MTAKDRAPEVAAVELDPVVDFYKRDIDRTLLRRNLEKTPTERVQSLIALQRLADEARRAGARPAQGR